MLGPEYYQQYVQTFKKQGYQAAFAFLETLRLKGRIWNEWIEHCEKTAEYSNAATAFLLYMDGESYSDISAADVLEDTMKHSILGINAVRGQ